MNKLFASFRWRACKIARLLGYRPALQVHGVRIPEAMLPPGFPLKSFDSKRYEVREATFIKKYLPPGADVMELGASLGIITCVILSRNPRRLVSVEAVPDLAERAKKIVLYNNSLGCPNWSLINSAIAYAGSTVEFTVSRGESLAGRVHDKRNVEQAGVPTEVITVPATSLSALNERCGIRAGAWLVCDIEGMEVDVVLNDRGALAPYAGVIMEAHNVCLNNTSYSSGDVIELFVRLGFDLRERKGRVAVLVRRPAAI